MDVFIGSVMTFSFPYAPRDWVLCAGQILSIQQYSTVYTLLGTVYGGNGTSTFGLPALQGRIPMGQGNGAGLTPQNMGDSQGVEKLALTFNNLPLHTHVASLGTLKPVTQVTLANPTSSPTTAPSASNAWIGASAASGDGLANIFSAGPGATPVEQKGVNTTVTGGITVAASGNTTPAEFGILNPFLVVNFSIAMQGIFPPRN